MGISIRAGLLAPVISIALLAGCGADDKPASSGAEKAPAAKASAAGASGPRPNYPPANPFLADSVLPVGHINSAQTTGFNHAGPSGPTEELTRENGGLTYTHMGPGHFGMAISPEYPNGKRVIWSNGADRISKLDYDTLDVLAEYHLTESAVQLLKAHNYRGNIRELRNILARAVVLTNTNVIDQGVIRQALATGAAVDAVSQEPLAESADLSLKEVEQRYLEQLMRQHGDDKEKVAAIAGVSVRSLYRKLQPRGPEG